MIYGIVEAVTLIENLGNKLDYCKIRIDFDEKMIYGDYAELCAFIGKEVEYAVRKDMYKGAPIEVVVNLFERRVVTTLSLERDIALLPDDGAIRSTTVSNFAIDTLKYGEVQGDCIAFLSSFECGASDKAQWVDCTLVDCKSKMFTMKVFSKDGMPQESLVDLVERCVGSYVIFDIISTKYGYQVSDDRFKYYNAPVVAPPEVETAIAIINQAVEGDEELKAYMTTYNYIDTLKKVIDGELGYNLVRIATELSLYKAMKGVSRLYDYKLLTRASIVSRGYLLGSKTKFSRPVLNVNKLLKTALSRDRELMLIVDVLAEEEASPTKNVFIEVSNLANRLVDERRGIYEEVGKSDVYSSLRSRVGGLLG